MIDLSEDITYDEFVCNITINGVTYKLFDEATEVTSANITKGMTLKVYNGEVVIKGKASDEKEDSSVIGTGDKIIIELSSETIEYTLAISGDVTGGGVVNIADVLNIADCTLNKNIQITN